MGAFATGFLLFGIALIYGVTGSFHFDAIRQHIIIRMEIRQRRYVLRRSDHAHRRTCFQMFACSISLLVARCLHGLTYIGYRFHEHGSQNRCLCCILPLVYHVLCSLHKFMVNNAMGNLCTNDHYWQSHCRLPG